MAEWYYLVMWPDVVDVVPMDRLDEVCGCETEWVRQGSSRFVQRSANGLVTRLGPFQRSMYFAVLRMPGKKKPHYRRRCGLDYDTAAKATLDSHELVKTFREGGECESKSAGYHVPGSKITILRRALVRQTDYAVLAITAVLFHDDDWLV
jgi:hypothetical protein